MEAHTDLASATLAELYYHQGQIQEAVQTYERVLEARPNDAKAQSRLNELNRLLHRPESPATEPIAEARRHTERLVAVFGGWLERIQEMSHAPQSH
jgi:tetratricopeptide (TPR) repeat protein